MPEIYIFLLINGSSEYLQYFSHVLRLQYGTSKYCEIANNFKFWLVLIFGSPALYCTDAETEHSFLI